MAVDAGKTLGPWRLIDELGHGGNGTVWRAEPNGGGEHVALKTLHSKRPDSEPYKRFMREVEFLRKLGDYDGVLPVIDAHLPDRPTKDDRAWLAMPIATPIAEALRDAPLDDVARAIRTIAATLARLADEHGVGHRDIKPGNLYALDGEWLIGDFGLIDVPDVDELTRSDRPMGPANFTAYEVILDPKNAESGPADVFSLGKTLWSLATGVNWPPLGHQPAQNSGHGIADHRRHRKARELDQLVDRMTRLEPSARPSMRQVALDLAAWEQLAPEPDALDVTDLGAQLRAKLSRELAAYDRNQQRKELAMQAVRSLQTRLKPLNDALRQVHPRPEIDQQHDKLMQNVLGKRHSHWGQETLFEWLRHSSITVGPEHSPFALRMGRCIELLDDGTLLARWLINVGPVKYAGSELNEHRTEYAAPVGSVEQERMLDQFVADMRATLTTALQVFVEKAPATGG